MIELLKDIFTTLVNAVSAETTTNVYYLILPDEELLKSFTVVYDLKNNSNLDSFDDKELLKNYQLDIKINYSSTRKILTNKVFISSEVYNLTHMNTAVKCVNLIDEDLFWDFDLKIYTGYLKFNVQYSN